MLLVPLEERCVPDDAIVLAIGHAEVKERAIARERDCFLDHVQRIVEPGHLRRVPEPDGVPVRVQLEHFRGVASGERAQPQAFGLQSGQAVGKRVRGSHSDPILSQWPDLRETGHTTYAVDRVLAIESLVSA